MNSLSATVSSTLRVVPDVTQLLDAIVAGDPTAADQLLPLVYEELRRLAAYKMSLQPPGQTLQATALVHEAYLRLLGDERENRWSRKSVGVENRWGQL